MRASRRRLVAVGLVALALPLALAGSMLIGAYPVPAPTLLRLLVASLSFRAHAVDPGWTPAQFAVVDLVRAPRVAMAALAGAGLGVSGAALQGVFRNPLVGPDIVGVSSGAACGGVLAISLGWAAAAVVGCAFAGGLLAVVLVTALARAGRGGVLTLVLAGVVVGGFFSALLGVMQFLADPSSTLPAIVYWLMGSFADADRAKLATLAAVVLIGGGVLTALRWRLNLLSLGEADAAALGVPVAALRWLVVLAVSLIVAGQVAVSGVVAWAGLVTPHMARMLVGPDHRRLVPASAWIGALFLLLVDDAARSFPTQELPVGLLTTLIGTPIFAALLWKFGSAGWRND